MPNDADQEIFRLTSEWVTHREDDDPNADYHHNRLNQILEIFEAEHTTELGVLQTLKTLFQNTDLHGKYMLLCLMDDLVYISTRRGGYGYPELFWLVLESNVLFEFSDISEVGRVVAGFLCRTGGIETTRSYLVHTLLGGDTTKHPNAFMGFYATGHSLHSLKIVIEVAPEPSESNAQLYVFIYGDAWTFLIRNKDVKLTAEDKVVFTAFFRRGLASTNKFVTDYCQKAIAILEAITG